jgi:copper chaperone NosL
MARLPREIRAALAPLVGLALIACATSGPPAIRIGSPCAGCGMTIEDRRFACERLARGAWKQYDSIECLARDGGVGGAIWLSDYDRAALAPTESLWVVRGDFPSPMGGGLAAFRDRAAADEVAARTRGRVGRLAEIATAEAGR